MTPLWAYESARDFWTRSGQPTPGFPRDLRQAVALALPLAVVDLPDLRLDSMRIWLAARGSRIPLSPPDRRVCACLVARGGRGIVFLDGTDPDDQRRYSLAHEVAHFLVEHVVPRRRVVHHVGPSALDVLDGRRPPTTTERVHALLARLPLAVDVHYLGRSVLGMPEHLGTSLAEQRAETLALELLAPMDALDPYLASGLVLAELVAVLTQTFGLPAPVARYRARQLVPPPPASARLLDSLRLD